MSKWWRQIERNRKKKQYDANKDGSVKKCAVKAIDWSIVRSFVRSMHIYLLYDSKINICCVNSKLLWNRHQKIVDLSIFDYFIFCYFIWKFLVFFFSLLTIITYTPMTERKKKTQMGKKNSTNNCILPLFFLVSR